jgi:hypothetical protein
LKEGYLGTIDLTGAMKSLKMLSDLGNSAAMFNYSYGLKEGYLGTIDLCGALKYYKMS